jgi:hypothetical protein
VLDSNSITSLWGEGPRAASLCLVWSSPARLRGGVKRGRHHVSVVNLRRIAGTLDMSLSELFAEVEGKERREG